MESDLSDMDIIESSMTDSTSAGDTVTDHQILLHKMTQTNKVKLSSYRSKGMMKSGTIINAGLHCIIFLGVNAIMKMKDFSCQAGSSFIHYLKQEDCSNESDGNLSDTDSEYNAESDEESE